MGFPRWVDGNGPDIGQVTSDFDGHALSVIYHSYSRGMSKALEETKEKNILCVCLAVILRRVG